MVAEIRSLLHREHSTRQPPHFAQLTNSGFKSQSSVEMKRTADIYLRSQNISDLHVMLLEQIGKVDTLM